jgi:hypothetical protein
VPVPDRSEQQLDSVACQLVRQLRERVQRLDVEMSF